MKKPKDIFDLLGVPPEVCPRRHVNCHQGDLLIVGGGRCVWTDTQGLPVPSNVMCINDMGMYWPGRITHWYSNDIDQLIHWRFGRRRPYNEFGGYGNLHSATQRHGAEYSEVTYWPFPTQGSSGLLALYVALAMGYDPITIAGCPWDDNGHFFDPPNGHCIGAGRRWTQFSVETPEHYLKAVAPLCVGRVRALSGRLKEILEG